MEKNTNTENQIESTVQETFEKLLFLDKHWKVTKVDISAEALRVDIYVEFNKDADIHLSS
ncbi:MAG: hypothetical protein LBC44_02655 [Mycoplasmataceae bacterium]|jgi:hypothetical protein|nr:hypothetical protein [Mycoplasmataceae bacterium]